MNKEVAQNILEKGTDIIYKNGYHNVGLQKILDASGIPKGSFYHYFKSKEDFGLRVIDFYSQQTTAFLKTFLENEDLNPRDRIFELLETMKGIYLEQNFSMGCLLGNCSLELGAQKQSFAKKVSRQFDSWQYLFERTIKEGQDLDKIKKDYSSKEYASFLLNSWEGAMVRMKSTKNNEPMDLLISFMKTLL